MAELIQLKNNIDARGELTVIQNEIAFEIKRVYYITNVENTNIVRGGHRHHTAIQALICMRGACTIYVNNGKIQQEFILDNHAKLLLVQPEDWHEMKQFSSDAILLVLASTNYDPNDYIDEKYDDTL